MSPELSTAADGGDCPVVSIVIPVYNEEETVAEMCRRLDEVGRQLGGHDKVEFIFVDDGSRDRTSVLLTALALSRPYLKVIRLSRNFGHQIALTAGVDAAKGRYVAIIDGDLQDPPERVPDMLAIARSRGVDVVYGKRRSRKGETWFKMTTASMFYRLLSLLCDVEIPRDTGDFRLMSRRVVTAFTSLRERHRFVRGMIPWLGYTSEAFEYDRDERFAGSTKYPLKKMVAFAFNAVLAFSRKPLAVAMRIGTAIVGCGLIGAVYMLYLKLFTEIPVPGVTSILVTIVIFGGIQIFLLGVVGEYVARVFDEVKGRPLYLIDSTVNL